MLPFTNITDYSELFLNENLFLIGIALVWITAAVIQDFRKREVANWWNFSLIVFALAYRAFLSIENWNAGYFLWGMIGLVGGFALANIFYYGRMFAGGDAKLMMALGTTLPLSLDWRMNAEILFWFLMLLVLSGAVYGAVYSIFLVFSNIQAFGREFKKLFFKNMKIVLSVLTIAALAGFISINPNFRLLIYFAVLIFISPILFIYAKAIENSCMNRLVDVKDLTIGDWTIKNIKAGRKTIKPNWEGLSEEELKIIRQRVHGKVLVKQGIPFTPAFLMAFLAMLLLFYYGLGFLAVLA